MNLSDFIDRLLEVENECRLSGAKAPVEIPVYVFDSRNGDSNLVMSVGIGVNKHGVDIQGELLDLDEGLRYIEVGVG